MSQSVVWVTFPHPQCHCQHTCSLNFYSSFLAGLYAQLFCSKIDMEKARDLTARQISVAKLAVLAPAARGKAVLTSHALGNTGVSRCHIPVSAAPLSPPLSVCQG